MEARRHFDFKRGQDVVTLVMSDGAEIEYTASAIERLRQHAPEEYRRLVDLIDGRRIVS